MLKMDTIDYEALRKLLSRSFRAKIQITLTTGKVYSIPIAAAPFVKMLSIARHHAESGKDEALTDCLDFGDVVKKGREIEYC